MINEAVEFIRREVREYLPGVGDTEVITGNAHVLKEAGNQQGVYISLVNVQQESTLTNSPSVIRDNNQTFYQEPAVNLNIYLLFSYEFGDYNASLLRLSQTIELFQSKRYMSSENEIAANPFPANLHKLMFDLHSMDFENLNHLWGILGGSYFPSVLYKVRMLEVQRIDQVPAEEITTIEVNTGLS